MFAGTARTLSWAIRIRVAIDAARGLAFLHNSEEQVIYRDFKTSNILLDAVCLIDLRTRQCFRFGVYMKSALNGSPYSCIIERLPELFHVLRNSMRNSRTLVWQKQDQPVTVLMCPLKSWVLKDTLHLNIWLQVVVAFFFFGFLAYCL